jgi:hypothetical protein
MEEDLFRSSLRQRGSVGWPSNDESPRTTSSAEPTTIRPLPSNETGQGASTARSVPPPEGNAAPVADAPTGLFYDGPSYAGMRSACPEGYEHGENYGGRLLVDDDEAASRAEGYFITRGRPRGRRLIGARSAVHSPAPEATLQTPFDGRERESASLPRPSNESSASWQGWSIMVALTLASVASSAPHHAPFSQSKFHSFHFHFELFEICSYFAFFSCFFGIYPFILLWKDLGGHVDGRPQLV